MFKESLIIGIFASIFMIGCEQKADTPFNIEYEKYTLDNGLTVILHEDKSDPIVRPYYWCGNPIPCRIQS